MYQDGPYALLWSDHMGWRWTLDEQCITLNTSSGIPLTLRLGADMNWHSEYSLRVDVVQEGNYPHLPEPPRAERARLPTPHTALKLTLPGHVKRVLQLQGYDVQLQGPTDGLDAGNPLHFLTLSRTNTSISIQFSYVLHPPDVIGADDPHGLDDHKQTLSLRADVKCTLAREHGVSTGNKDAVRTLTWEDKLPWKQELPTKQITLPLATGGQVVLRLGFYFLWYSEYCLVVEASDAAPSSSWAVRTYQRLAGTSKELLRIRKEKRKEDTGTGRSN